MSDYVLLEYMPAQFVETHRAAKNFGVYPHNGAVQIVVSRDVADHVVEDDADGYARIVRDATEKEWLADEMPSDSLFT